MALMSYAGSQGVVLQVILCCLMQTASAQQHTSQQVVSFTSPDGAFSFSYPTDFRLCGRGAEQCLQSYIPICDDDVIVCIVYSPPEFKNMNFGPAGFQIREITEREEMMTPDVCVTPYPRKDGPWPEFKISAKHPTESINSVQFVHGISVEAAMSHWLQTDLYRGFHNKRC